MRVTFKFREGRGGIVAFFDLEYGDFIIKDFKIRDGRNGMWAAMPSTKYFDKEKQEDAYRDNCYLPSRDRRDAFSALAVSEYEKWKATSPAPTDDDGDDGPPF